jgi:replicative superfamily II helicase
MIDFSKRIEQQQNGKPTNPSEIYETLDRASDKGPLRPAQFAILEEWFKSRRDEKDIIIKLHTGQGKTLIGLLVLKSRLNEGLGPVLYVCPNKYLADQTREQARQFGIKTCDFDSSNNFPAEFWDNSSVLITYVQKIFNGLSKFGLRNSSINVNTVVLDDSHACIDSIEAATTLQIPRSSELYDEIIAIFKEVMEEQGFAKFHEILVADSNEVMIVPYWAWYDLHRQVAEKVIEYKEESFILFVWPVVRDVITSCNCYIAADRIEIKPFLSPVDVFGTFSRAEHRIMMSATTNNDAFFVKNLGVSPDAIRKPLIYEKENWSGEKLILIPYHIDDQLNRTEVVNWLAQPIENRKVGLVALTPSFADAEFWEMCGGVIAKSDNLAEQITLLRAGQRDNVIVFANRYDGIDLPDDSCRVLVLDNQPYGQTLEDKYFEDVRSNSQVINIKVAQKIEQGLGRGVRGQKDYCVILLTGNRLVSSIKNPRFKKFFSPQTQQQVNIGIEVTKYAVEDINKPNPKQIVNDAINQVLRRDEGWKNFYKMKMDQIDQIERDYTVLDILQLEREAEIAYNQGDHVKSKDIIWKIVSQYCSDDQLESGFYYQEMARIMYPVSKSESNKLQIVAHRDNRSLLRPKDGMIFKKLEIEGKRVERIQRFLSNFDDYSELKAQLEVVLGHLDFNPETKRFEIALEEVGKILGFSSERPEEAWKEGPDNLWCISPGEYILFECKSGTKKNRAEIHQKEAEQLLNSNRWFQEKYTDCIVTPVMIINPVMVTRGAFLPENGKILDANGLFKLKKRIRSFYKELANQALNQLSDLTIQELIKSNELRASDIKSLLKTPKYYK